MSKDNCNVISSGSTIEMSSKKRKRDEDDSPQSRFCCFVCDCEVSGDLAMQTHLNSAQHKANTLKRKKNADSIPAVDKPTESTVVTPKSAETIPTTAKSSISIPDSSTAILSKPAPDSSVSQYRTFLCAECELDVAYSNDNLSFIERYLERKWHSTMHTYGLSSPHQKVTCTVCKCRMIGKNIPDHKNSPDHQRAIGAMKIKGNDSGLFRPFLSRQKRSRKACETFKSVINDLKVTTGNESINLTCTLCKCSLTDKEMWRHKNIPEHQRKVVEMGMKGNDSGIFIPNLSHPDQAPKATATLSTISKVGLQPTLKDPKLVPNLSQPDKASKASATLSTVSKVGLKPMLKKPKLVPNLSQPDQAPKASATLSTISKVGLQPTLKEPKLVPNLSQPDQAPKASATLSTVPKVGLQSAIKDPKVTTGDTKLSKDKIEPSKASATLSTVSKFGPRPTIKDPKVTIGDTQHSKDKIEPSEAISTSSTVSEDSSELELVESPEVVPHLTFYCNICQRELCGQIILEEHLRGRCHASNVCGNRGYISLYYKIKPANRLSPEILNGLHPRIARMASKDPYIRIMHVGNMIQFHCALCKNLKILGRQELNKHFQSDLHKMKVKEIKEIPEPPATQAPPATSSVVKPIADKCTLEFYCDHCAIYSVNRMQAHSHYASEAHKKMVASEGAGAVVPSRGSEEWVARLPPNVAYCTVCAYEVFHISMIDQHRRSEPHKKYLAEMGIQFDENGIPTALSDASDGDAVDVKPHIIDPVIAADLFFGFSVVDNVKEEQDDL